MATIEEEIRAECLAFVKQNRGLTLDPESQRATNYISPRISSEYMDCSMPMTFDHYSHCSLGCTYCFAYMFKTQNSSFSEKLHSINVKKMRQTLAGKPADKRQRSVYKHFYSKRFLLHWGGLADPFCNFEKINGVGYEIVKALAEHKYPTLFSFKGSAIFRPKFVQLFDDYKKNKNFAFQVSIIAPSDKISKQIEIGVPVTSRRIDAIKMLHDMGYWTILRLRPFIIGITDDGLSELLERCREAGINGVSMEFVAIDQRCNAALIRRYKWLGKLIGTKNIMKYFTELSPKERGGYMRLNRLVKEPFVKKVYQFCVKHKLVFACSDPDFKELNMSGSCCGMPDNFPANRELENWTKNQLTYALKEARRRYHSDGRLIRFKFHKIFKEEEDTYLSSVGMGQDHPGVAGTTASFRKNITYLKIARNAWNNLRSPANPRNYFHGKMMPILKDDRENLVFQYAPSEYEERWKEEGIDLSK